MRQVNHRWIPRDIIGGDSALDLVNTVSGWEDDAEDWIPDAGSFLDWARMSGLLNIYEKNQAAHMAAASPDSVERVRAALKELRFALWHLIDSLQHGKPAKPGYVSVLNDWTRRLGLSRHVTFRHSKLDFALDSDISIMDVPGHRVTAAALALLMDPPAGRIKTCSGANCGWKFVDKSKNSSRRWCDMAVCGNLVKARHYRLRNE
jgi:predicted RNA-binding Zn ribbon-like protein